MSKVYDLRQDPQRVERIQNATLNTEDYGLLSAHGLFGSSEWWRAIEHGRLPVHFVEGVITDVYETGYDDWPQFEVDDGTRKSHWTRMGDDAEYIVGSRVRIEYVVEKHKPRWSSPENIERGLDKAEIVLSISIYPRWTPPTEHAELPVEQPHPGSVEQAHPFRVIARENFHYMDDTERYHHGEFDSCAAAIAACEKLVDDYLLSAYKPGMTVQELWASYTTFGDDPFIVTGDDSCSFSAWDYARKRCAMLCRPLHGEPQ